MRELILNVDDFEPQRFARSAVLRRAGFEVIEAGTGQRALALVREQQPALVVLDVHLPDVDGLEVCRRIKADPAYARTIVLHVSATFTEARSRALALENGADGYLPEPLEPDELVAQVRSLLRLARAEARARQREEELRESEGRLAAALAERARQEEEARAQSELLSAVIDNIPVILVIWDPSLRSFRFNRHARSVLGWTEADAADGRFMERAYPDPDHRRVVSEYMKSLQPGWRDLKTTAKNGEEILISWANVNLPGGGSIGIGVDMRERRRVEQERDRTMLALRDANARLEEADRRKDEFIAILSHELRNPLAPIRYAIPVIKEHVTEERSARALAVIDRQAHQLKRLVDDLLDVSRISSGRMELRRRPVTLSAVVGAAIDAASAAIAARGHTLEVKNAGEGVYLSADAARLSQVITNLLDNSAKYTPPGGRIWLEAGSEAGEAVIRVRDSGIGIPAAAIGSVFEMFERVSREDSQPGGMGIGLALARRLVEMHGGRITIASPGIGQGTEALVRLPLAEEAARAPEEARPGRPGPPKRLKVLVVDDNVDLVEMLSMVVSCAGHDVVKAHDGPGAIEAAVSCRPEVVLLDLGLPGMGGLDVARRLRVHPELAGLRIVALTGLGQPSDLEQTREAGFDHHLTKPTSPEDVERLLTTIAAELHA